MLLRWLRIDREEREKLWPLYGWFTTLMTGGSCFGMVSWVSWMQRCLYYYKVSDSPFFFNNAKNLNSLAIASRWTAAFKVSYAAEFLCITAAKLLTLDRMVDFATPLADARRKRWMVMKRVVMAAVLAINAVGLGGNIGAAALNAKTADSYAAASAACCNSTLAFETLTASLQHESDAFELSSVQMWCEVAVLLLVLSAFAVAGAVGLARVRSTMRSMTEPQRRLSITASNQLQLQIFSTTALIFVSFLLRSVFSSMFAVANQLQEVKCDKVSRDKLSLCKEDCYNDFFHMRVWMASTPEFQLIVVLLSSPITVLVALWGMTSKRMLQQMKLSQQQNPSLLPVSLHSIK
jgi:hypothetical protein